MDSRSISREGVKKEVVGLSNKLKTIRDVVDDAEKRGVKDQSVQNWLKMLEDTAYDMDDILDEWKSSRPVVVAIPPPPATISLSCDSNFGYDSIELITVDNDEVVKPSPNTTIDRLPSCDQVGVEGVFQMSSTLTPLTVTDVLILPPSPLSPNSSTAQLLAAAPPPPSAGIFLPCSSDRIHTLSIIPTAAAPLQVHECDRVDIHYKGKLIDGTIFDPPFERGDPIDIKLECWRLLRHISLSGRGDEECREFEDVGHKIARKCKGLPLAASLLQFKDNLEEWENVLESEIRQLEKAEVELFPHLLLSYNELSPTLKRCFSYCAIYPKDLKINVKRLIEEWMALGYLGSVSENGGVELKGREYFNKLAMSSLFQDFEISYDSREQIKWCKMHDIVHDFARFVRKNNGGVGAAERLSNV
ncbi:hypothetical protein SASPL_140631 [Salvia splendens]|uniref:Disease resistance protein RPM1 n=1 Tax=Salvia splendens TaxID=180675 RepID=A0A8X8WQT4_SALSN|nr:hypothetical protein SASPL_140631 [Salvia splendens]